MQTQQLDIPKPFKSDNELTCKDRNVHWYCGSIRFIEANTKISLPTQKQQDEHAYMHQANSSCKPTYLYL